MLIQLYDDQQKLVMLHDTSYGKFYHVLLSLGDWVVGFEAGVCKRSGPEAPCLLLLIDNSEDIKVVSLERIYGKVSERIFSEGIFNWDSREVMLVALRDSGVLGVSDRNDQFAIVEVEERQYILSIYEAKRGDGGILTKAERVDNNHKSKIFCNDYYGEIGFISYVAQLFSIVDGKIVELKDSPSRKK